MLYILFNPTIHYIYIYIYIYICKIYLHILFISQISTTSYFHLQNAHIETNKKRSKSTFLESKILTSMLLTSTTKLIKLQI